MRKVKLRLKLLWYVTKGRASAPPGHRHRQTSHIRHTVQGTITAKSIWCAVEMMSLVMQASLQAYDGYMTTNDYMDMAEQM